MLYQLLQPSSSSSGLLLSLFQAFTSRSSLSSLLLPQASHFIDFFVFLSRVFLQDTEFLFVLDFFAAVKSRFSVAFFVRAEFLFARLFQLRLLRSRAFEILLSRRKFSALQIVFLRRLLHFIFSFVAFGFFFATG